MKVKTKTITLSPAQYAILVAYNTLFEQFVDMPEELNIFEVVNWELNPNWSGPGAQNLYDSDRGFKAIVDETKMIFDRFKTAYPEILPLCQFFGVEYGHDLNVNTGDRYDTYKILIRPWAAGD